MGGLINLNIGNFSLPTFLDKSKIVASTNDATINNRKYNVAKTTNDATINNRKYNVAKRDATQLNSNNTHIEKYNPLQNC